MRRKLHDVSGFMKRLLSKSVSFQKALIKFAVFNVFRNVGFERKFYLTTGLRKYFLSFYATTATELIVTDAVLQ